MRSFLYAALVSYTLAGAAVAAPSPGQLVSSKAVATDGIERYLLPAGASSGLPQTIQGLWWGAHPNKQFLLSFGKASWDASTRTASLVFNRPGVFGYPTSRSLGNATAEFDKVDAAEAGYQAVFSADFRRVELLFAKTAADGTRQTVDKGLSLELSADGAWIMRAPGSDDVTLRRIVDAGGKREAAYKDYQKSFGAAVEVYGSAAILTPPQPLTLDLEAGDQVLVKVGSLNPNGNDGPVGPTPVTIHAEATAPLRLDAYADIMQVPVSSLDGRNVLLSVRGYSADGFVAVSSPDGKPQHVTLTATAAPVSTVDERQPLTIDLAAGEIRLVQVAPTSGHDGIYRLHIAGSVPAPVYLGGGDASVNPLSGAFVQSHGLLGNYPAWEGQTLPGSYLVVGDAHVATTQTLSLSKEGGEVSARGKIVLDGPSVSGKLSGIGDLDTYHLIVPAGFKDPQVQIVMDDASLNRFAMVSFSDPVEALEHIYGFAHGTHVVSTDDWSAAVYVNPGAFHLAVAYYGDFNVANPDLTYSFSVKTKPSN